MTTAHASAARTSAAPKAAPPVMRAAAAPARTAAPPLASLAAIPAGPIVQRECADCEAEDKEPGLQRRINASASAASVQRKCDSCAAEEEETGIQPRLDVGPVGDRYEREADSIAAQVMAMPLSDTGAVADDASSAAGAVQRACSACSALREEPRARRLADPGDEEGPLVRARRDGGAETIAASDAQLTSGGSELPGVTRRFFEARMGRDLGEVRVHSGSDARAKNASISARAFTYKNHVWLGAGESASPSFTMAHELAHVMQQTAPGPVGPQRREASEADGAVQRKENAFWLPHDRVGAKGYNTAMHNAAVKDLAKHNKTLSEVPIPGANRRFAEIGAKGRADIYTAKVEGKNPIMVPGVEQVAKPAAPGPPAGTATDPPATTAPAAPIAASIDELGNFSIGAALEPMTNGEDVIVHDTRRAPKIENGRLINIPEAPNDILIGEVKPAHDLDYRESGKDQIANYIAGIERVAKKVDEVAIATGANGRWNANPKPAGKLKVPPGWDAAKSHNDWDYQVKIRHYEADKAKPGGAKAKVTAKDAKQGRPTAQPIRGRWMMAADNMAGHEGVFVYFMAPHPKDLANALKPRSTRTKFRSLAAKIKKIQQDLITAPKPAPGGAKVKPRRLAQPATTAVPATPATASPMPRRVARKEVKDNFKAATWEAERTGAGLAEGATDDSLLGTYGTVASDDMREEIAQQGAMAEWLKTKPPTPGTAYENNGGNAKLVEDLSLLKSADFWTSLKARPFGILREKFGLFFVKAYEKVTSFGKTLRDKFHGVSEGKILAGKSGTIFKAAAKVASVVLPRLVKPFMAKMLDTIINCGVQGFEAKFRELIQGTIIDDIIQTAEELKDKVENIANDVEAFFKDIVDNTIKPIHDEFEDFVNTAKLVLDVVGFVKEITTAIRIGSCVAGLAAAGPTVGVGAVVGCGAALGDYILSKFGLSPVDHLIGTILSSCEMQNRLGKLMAGLAFVKKLPERAGKEVVTKVKDLLAGSDALKSLGSVKGKNMAQHASELFCNPADMKFPDMGYEKTDCNDTGSYRRSKTDKYDIPGSVPLYRKRDPEPASEAPWKGVEIPAGREGDLAPMPDEEKTPLAPVAPPPDDKKPPADTKPPTDDKKPPADVKPTEPAPPAQGEPKAPAGGANQGGTTPAEIPDQIKEGHIPNASPTKIVLAIYGGFDPKTAFDGTQLRGAHLAGTASDGTVYGPVPVDIYVHKLIMEKPYWRISFKFKLADPKKNLVLTDGKTNRQLELYDSAKLFTIRWRSPNKMPNAGEGAK